MLGHSIVSQHIMELEGSIPNSYPEPDQSSPPHPTSPRSILILSTHLRFGLPSGLFPPLLNIYISHIRSLIFFWWSAFLEEYYLLFTRFTLEALFCFGLGQDIGLHYRMQVFEDTPDVTAGRRNVHSEEQHIIPFMKTRCADWLKEGWVGGTCSRHGRSEKGLYDFG
jgi:hypothetical protein